MGACALTPNSEGYYLIGSAQDLQDFAVGINDGTIASDANAKLTANIDLNGSEDNQWTPIGTDANRYNGSFDGQGYTIKNLFFKQEVENIGLFGFSNNNAIIKNVRVEGFIDITNPDGNNDAGKNRTVGGIVGFAVGSTIINCSFSGSVASYSHVGGIVGWANNSVKVVNCYNEGIVTVYSHSLQEMGGIVGKGSAVCINCYNVGDLQNALGGSVIIYPIWRNVETCYYRAKCCKETNNSSWSNGNGGGIAMSEAEMKAEAFVTILNENVNSLKESYPDISEWKVTDSYPCHLFEYVQGEVANKGAIMETYIMDGTSQPPVAGGIISNNFTGTIRERGLLLTTSNVDFGYDGTSCANFKIVNCTDVTTNGQFMVALKELKGNTTYYLRAYLKTDDNVYYGDIKKIQTQNFNRCNASFDYANVQYSNYYTLFDLMSDEIIEGGFYYSTNEYATSYGYSTDRSKMVYKFKTEWSYRLWYSTPWSTRTNFTGTPILTFKNGNLIISKNIVDANKNVIIYYCINGDYKRPENFTDIYSDAIRITGPSVIACYAKDNDNILSNVIYFVVTEEMLNDSPRYYTVTLDHNKGVGDPEQISVAYNQPMPENIGLVAPTRTGYEFTGYSRSGTYYYDANLKSVRNFDQKQDYTLYANGKARTTTVTLNPQGGTNGTAKVTATYGKAMPTGEKIVAPTRAGYTFEGYYSSTNGNGTQYYNADMTSKRTWNKEASSATLYAYWKASSIPVAAIDLSANSATLWVGKSKTITATVSPTTATKTSVTWSSSNTQVATVSSKGVVKAIGKGTCVITCTAADGYGAKAECEVSVKQQVTSIDFGYKTLSVTCGTTKTLTPKINPSNASVQTLSWKSKNTSVATVTSAGVLKAIAPGTAKIICTATDGFKKADTITVEVVPLKITDSKPTIAEGTYGIGGIVYTRTLTEGRYAAFCLPYNVNLNDYTDEFAKVYVPMGMAFLKPNGTLMVMFKKVSLTETIKAGKPFVALAAKSGAVAITNDYKKTFTTLTNPEPASLDVYNWSGSNGFLDFNPDVTTKIGGTYGKLTGLDSEKYYIVSTSGTMSKAASISPYRIYVYKDDNNSNAKVTEIIFSFDEDEMATGVENITNDLRDDDKIYNINGQRINKANAQKGIYIKNGKKYANKN